MAPSNKKNIKNSFGKFNAVNHRRPELSRTHSPKAFHNYFPNFFDTVGAIENPTIPFDRGH